MDACTLFPPTLRNILLHAAAFDLLQPYWSDMILEELRRNLVKRVPMDEEKAASWITKMRSHFPASCVPLDPDLPSLLPNHPKDRHVLAVAIEAEAGLIVTRNMKDFPEASLKPYGVEACTPDDFLIARLQAFTAEMIYVVYYYADTLTTPSQTPQQVLTQLSKTTPLFARRMLRLIR